MGEIVSGTIIGADTDGLLIRVPYSNWKKFTRQGNERVLVQLIDGRHITVDQISLAWVLMGYIGLDAGYQKNETYEFVYRKYFAKRFALDYMRTLRKRAFHLSQATVQEGSDFIRLLIDHCVQNGVQTGMPLYELAEDIQSYVYSSLIYKKCAVCGRKTELHHVDAVGMGRDRKQICHIGMRCLPLCRKHHMEAHNLGNDRFMARYHLEPVTIDQDIAKRYKLKKEGATNA